jgi:hypothetical protein
LRLISGPMPAGSPLAIAIRVVEWWPCPSHQLL